MRRLFTVVLWLGCSGCGAAPELGDSHQRYTAGHVGCPPSEIEISNDVSDPQGRYWRAQCRGRTFHCSFWLTMMACTEELPTAGP